MTFLTNDVEKNIRLVIVLYCCIFFGALFFALARENKKIPERCYCCNADDSAYVILFRDGENNIRLAEKNGKTKLWTREKLGTAETYGKNNCPYEWEIVPVNW